MRALLTALLAFAPLAAAAAPLASGAYDDGLILAVDAAGQVTGEFSMTQGEQPSFSCVFFLKGRVAGAKADVDTWYVPDPADDHIRGTLTSTAPKTVQIRLPSEHGGCWNVQHFADAETPAEFTLSKAYPWTEVRVAKAAKTYFYDSPTAATHRKAYVTKGDGLGVRAAQGTWLQVDYVGGSKPVSGWVRAADVY